MTQVFYDNMKLIDNLWGFLTLLSGQPILITIIQMAKRLYSLETCDRVYAYRKWHE
jgi:hypothetical protein